jgi:hypothetical protein
MDEMTKRVLSDRSEVSDHHEAAENILRVQRQIALANLPHSYRLFDLATLRGKLANRDVQPGDDEAVDRKIAAGDAKP